MFEFPFSASKAAQKPVDEWNADDARTLDTMLRKIRSSDVAAIIRLVDMRHLAVGTEVRKRTQVAEARVAS